MRNLNIKKLSKSNFIDQLLVFAKDYENATNIDIYNDVANWIIEEKYDLIKEFLSSKILKDVDINLIDSQKILYKRFISFYE